MDFKVELKNKYGYMTDNDIENIVNKAMMFYYNLKYPADSSVDPNTSPIQGFRDEQWILSACDELIERLGFSSAIGYRENGMSWAFDNAQLSDRLCSQIKPVIGVIK